MEKTDIHIIGLGNLGSAFLEGLMTSNKEHSIKVYELDTSVLEVYEKNIQKMIILIVSMNSSPVC